MNDFDLSTNILVTSPYDIFSTVLHETVFLDKPIILRFLV